MVIMLCLFLTLTVVSSSVAEKARGISSDTASAYHIKHLEQHLFATDLHGTGNYLKIREQSMDSMIAAYT
jgi:hypothetical protein